MLKKAISLNSHLCFLKASCFVFITDRKTLLSIMSGNSWTRYGRKVYFHFPQRARSHPRVLNNWRPCTHSPKEPMETSSNINVFARGTWLLRTFKLVSIVLMTPETARVRRLCSASETPQVLSASERSESYRGRNSRMANLVLPGFIKMIEARIFFFTP